jgi:hypothetical protein
MNGNVISTMLMLLAGNGNAMAAQTLRAVHASRFNLFSLILAPNFASVFVG